MRETTTFAYSLSQVEDGWRWRVFDEDGEVVADGAKPTKADAQVEVDQTLRSPPSPCA